MTLRLKEIGIRKVLGSTVSQVIFLLSRKFMLLAMAGYLLSVPIAYTLMQKWLQGFAFRTDMDFAIFIYSGIALVIVSMVAVTMQSFKAAVSNPVDTLKEE